MPLLARNVFALGYVGQWPKGRPSEFLILLTRYVQQARELTALAGPDGGIHVSTCDEAKPQLARFFWALARMDAETLSTLRQSHVLKKMVAQAAALDFYGSHICIRSGRVVVPGGSAAALAWKELVGASPDSPGEFIPKLLAKDSGWLAAYFDDLSSVPPSQQTHFTEDRKSTRL